jgi:hypothetical protein
MCAHHSSTLLRICYSYISYGTRRQSPGIHSVASIRDSAMNFHFEVHSGAHLLAYVVLRW